MHVVDRLRTLRTWLLHPGGAAAVSAYALPVPAPRVPIPADVIAHAHERMCTSGPESHEVNDGALGEVKGSIDEFTRNATAAGEMGWEAKQAIDVREEEQQQQQEHKSKQQPSPESCIEDEEAVDPCTLTSGTLLATVISGPLPQRHGPCFLVMAGVALSGITFLLTSDVVPAGQHGGHGVLMDVEDSTTVWDGGRDEGTGVSRVLGMRAIVSGLGDLQALALLWGERPGFQLLDVGQAIDAAIVQEVPLTRFHR